MFQITSEISVMSEENMIFQILSQKCVNAVSFPNSFIFRAFLSYTEIG